MKKKSFNLRIKLFRTKIRLYRKLVKSFLYAIIISFAFASSVWFLSKLLGHEITMFGWEVTFWLIFAVNIIKIGVAISIEWIISNTYYKKFLFRLSLNIAKESNSKEPHPRIDSIKKAKQLSNVKIHTWIAYIIAWNIARTIRNRNKQSTGGSIRVFFL